MHLKSFFFGCMFQSQIKKTLDKTIKNTLFFNTEYVLCIFYMVLGFRYETSPTNSCIEGLVPKAVFRGKDFEK
jgi:hypothetical protein